MRLHPIEHQHPPIDLHQEKTVANRGLQKEVGGEKTAENRELTRKMGMTKGDKKRRWGKDREGFKQES